MRASVVNESLGRKNQRLKGFEEYFEWKGGSGSGYPHPQIVPQIGCLGFVRYVGPNWPFGFRNLLCQIGHFLHFTPPKLAIQPEKKSLPPQIGHFCQKWGTPPLYHIVPTQISHWGSKAAQGAAGAGGGYARKFSIFIFNKENKKFWGIFKGVDII